MVVGVNLWHAVLVSCKIRNTFSLFAQVLLIVMLSLSYIITRSGGSSPKTVYHTNDVGSSRIFTTWDGLAPGVTYTFTVTCQLQGEDCEGDPITFTASTCCGKVILFICDLIRPRIKLFIDCWCAFFFQNYLFYSLPPNQQFLFWKISSMWENSHKLLTILKVIRWRYNKC